MFFFGDEHGLEHVGHGLDAPADTGVVLSTDCDGILPVMPSTAARVEGRSNVDTSHTDHDPRRECWPDHQNPGDDRCEPEGNEASSDLGFQ